MISVSILFVFDKQQRQTKNAKEIRDIIPFHIEPKKATVDGLTYDDVKVLYAQSTLTYRLSKNQQNFYYKGPPTMGYVLKHKIIKQFLQRYPLNLKTFVVPVTLGNKANMVFSFCFYLFCILLMSITVHKRNRYILFVFTCSKPMFMDVSVNIILVTINKYLEL